MYNLIVTAEEGAWDGKKYIFPQQRITEHTDADLKNRFRNLDEKTIAELISLPTLFAYEKACDTSARVGRVTWIITRGKQVRLDFKIFEDIPAIAVDQITEMAFELDIDALEMNRTHWAIKNVDLIEVLEEAELVQPQILRERFSELQQYSSTSGLFVAPTVFRLSSIEREPDLVSVMMPFSKDFDPVYQAIRAACRKVGLRCKRVDDIWEESIIIQDVVNLICRSAVVVVDFSGRNPNVMYETGIAHTLGRPVVPISQSNSDLPFDLMHHRTLKYLANKQGLREMTEMLEQRLRRLTSKATSD